MSNIAKSNGETSAIAIVQKTLERAKPKIVQCIPTHLNPERMFRVYMMACVNNQRLASCTPMSLLGGVMQAAQFGLSLDTVTGEAWLIPRRSKHHQGKTLAVFQIGYKGLRKLARQGDEDLQDVFGYAVHENDEFSYHYGEEPKIEVHRPNEDDPGRMRAAYAVAVWKGGYRRFVVVTKGDILRAQAANWDAAQKDDSPWKQHPEAMWVKTATARLCRQLVLRTDVQVALQSDGRNGENILRDRAQEDTSLRSLAIEVGGAEAFSGPEEDDREPESAPAAQQAAEMTAKLAGIPEPAPKAKPPVRGKTDPEPS